MRCRFYISYRASRETRIRLPSPSLQYVIYSDLGMFLCWKHLRKYTNPICICTSCAICATTASWRSCAIYDITASCRMEVVYSGGVLMYYYIQ